MLASSHEVHTLDLMPEYDGVRAPSGSPGQYSRMTL